MAEPKTKASSASVDDFIAAQPETARADCQSLVKLMQKVSGAKPVLWGGSIVGFGTYKMTYANGKQNDWPIIAFSPRKANITLYLTCSFDEHRPLLDQLGKHKTGVGCLYLKTLADVDIKVLAKLLAEAVKARVADRSDKPAK